MTQITFIEDDDEGTTHHVQTDRVEVTATGVYTVQIRFRSTSAYPDNIRDLSPSQVQGWGVVVTHDGETMSGKVTKISSLTVTFNVSV